MSASFPSVQSLNIDISEQKLTELIHLLESYFSTQITLLSKISSAVQLLTNIIDISVKNTFKVNAYSEAYSSDEGVKSANKPKVNTLLSGDEIDTDLVNEFLGRWKSFSDRLDKFSSFFSGSLFSKERAKTVGTPDKHISAKKESFQKNSHEIESIHSENLAKVSRFVTTSIATVAASAVRVQRAATAWLGLGEVPQSPSRHLVKEDPSTKHSTSSGKEKSTSSIPVVKGNELPKEKVYIEPKVSKRDSRGIRNNNPGNLNFAGQKGASLEFPGGRFAKFDNAYDGIRAMGRQLLRYYDGKTTGHKRRTIEEIITTWAPPSDHNKTDKYIEHVAAKMGIASDAVLNIRDPEVLGGLMSTIIRHENTRNPYSDELIQAAASGAISQTINNKTDITIHGAGDPAMVGREVHKRQFHVNSQVAQALHPGVS